MAAWLFKTEPSTYSIDDLRRDKRTLWEGVRNYQARNFLRDSIALGDEVLFYHSNAEPPGIAGLARVVKAGYPDPAQFQERSKYFDPKASPKKPIWYVVDVAYVKKFPAVLSLAGLREVPGLEEMLLLRKGSRLSIQPVEAAEMAIIAKLAGVPDKRR